MNNQQFSAARAQVANSETTASAGPERILARQLAQARVLTDDELADVGGGMRCGTHVDSYPPLDPDCHND